MDKNLNGFYLLVVTRYDIIFLMEILESLNEEQRDALLSVDGANLVTAGAGTGKTRLLTHRIAYLIEELRVDPYNILAITFTNKAANEMKTRVQKLVAGGDRVWISTFHSMCVRILRKDIERLNTNYDKNFTIYSDTDTEKVLKAILKQYCIEDEMKNYSYHISNCKNKNMTIAQYAKEFDYVKNMDIVVKVYNEYQSQLQSCNALDFDDLLNKTYELFSTCPDVLDFYARRFEYILVDEFQDTNKIQYDLTKLLASTHKNLFVVGDEDQSIYSWRGADFTNIFNISKDFENTKIFKLQQNYRCTKNILEVANKLIALNDERFDKKLWTDKESDEKVVYKSYYDEQEEAENIAGTIYSLTHNHGYNFSDIAILVRLNALTLPFEEKLLSYNIPHKIYGGFKFFERAEIKSILSYLRLFINPKDEVSLLRIINFPKRGIGDGAIALLKDIAFNYNVSILDVIRNIQIYPDAKKLVSKLQPFADTFNNIFKSYNTMSLSDFIVKVIDDFKITDAYPKENEEFIDKLMNIDQFINSVKAFEKNNPDCNLTEYLESVTLQSDIDSMGEVDNVVISSIHAVKGLEFKVVFVVGMEEGVFPLSRCKDNPKELQEERRLAYVAFTRAEEKLFVSACKTRFLYGRRNYETESRFLSESGLIYKAPKKNLFENLSNNNNERVYGGFASDKQKTTSYGGINTYIPKPNNGSSGAGFGFNSNKVNTAVYKVGQVVGHTKFGIGTIKKIDGDYKFAEIDFTGLGVKTLMLEIAPLKIIK